MQTANLQTVYLLLGSNLGNREEILNQAITAIQENVGVIISQSKYYETPAWGKTDQPDFLNIALEIATNLMPLVVLEKTQAIEQQLGRVRIEKWGARLIDIDIIFYGQEIINISEHLNIPHPLMQERLFVLEPIAEIAPDFIHPVLKKSVSELLEEIS
ncbi:2-amino-4-hydroxy-6-hydroxymethyldihydropteridine diphosphokinase [Arcicella aurantiaca]|uniref:2-amino-4-hydroxy-6-hydroxymethyldihydropteridine pyrophosphokinase n=1 Tax=Arcicella aurantiaca TaxID=591202 RepID=A0A316EAD3_9BACT|nr:2-amino-4-hydroxy-6-hydroxymethyldihydropteridine diphosphokinase [Arcicella aurantiaca]PWK26299.1 2-amino-4-hydroxy-6-hydroxymethyldihydropteridine diphosphokinase [Arcicella aurantiaca]